ncbi:hypothetical protein ACVIEM_006650 [Rhizobium leguminosarum]
MNPAEWFPLMPWQFHLQELIGPRFRRAAVPGRGERSIAYIDIDRSFPVENNTRQGVCRYIEENKSG